MCGLNVYAICGLNVDAYGLYDDDVVGLDVLLMCLALMLIL